MGEDTFYPLMITPGLGLSFPNQAQNLESTELAPNSLIFFIPFDIDIFKFSNCLWKPFLYRSHEEGKKSKPL